MRLFYLFFLVSLSFSCNTETKPKPNKEVISRAELSQDSKIFFGNRLFSEKTCITCHAIDTRKIGPSVIEIMTVYKEQKGDIVQFLQGNAKPILDTDTAQIAIMQANIDGFLKDISVVELDAISTYMLHVDELQAK